MKSLVAFVVGVVAIAIELTACGSTSEPAATDPLFDLKADPGQQTNVIDKFPEELARLRAEYDQWWKSVQPGLVNEKVRGPKVNPFKERYWKQFGGGPDEALRKRMDPEFSPYYRD